MKSAIESALHYSDPSKDLSKPFDDTVALKGVLRDPRIFSFHDEELKPSYISTVDLSAGAYRHNAITGDCNFWDIVPTTLDREEVPRWRLMQRYHAGRLPCPLVSDDLRKRLIFGNFEDVGDSANRAVPDIVVIDDLGMRLHDDRFSKQISECLKYLGSLQSEDCIKPENEETTFRRKASELLSDKIYSDRATTSIGRNAEPPNTNLNDRDKHYCAALAALIRRLEYAAKYEKESRRTQMAHLEPVIVLSLTGALPTLDTHGNVWNEIFQNVELRKRTIVLLDSADLRQDLSISSGLSWERTAQDTIVELGLHSKWRNFLKFGHLIVRFGVTGALLVTNRNDSSWIYTLCFDPARDDASWTHPDHGTVLGTTSLYVATIVESLTTICRRRAGALHLSDLESLLGDAVSLAITRSQQHLAFGYGQTFEEWSLLRINSWFGPTKFQPPLGLEESVSPGIGRTIQQIQVSPLRSLSWSIVSESTQTRAIKVAENIVKRGTKVTINTVRDPARETAQVWFRLIFARKVNPLRESFAKSQNATSENPTDPASKLSAKNLAKWAKKAANKFLNAPNVERLLGADFFGKAGGKPGEKFEVNNSRLSRIIRKMVNELVADLSKQSSEGSYEEARRKLHDFLTDNPDVRERLSLAGELDLLDVSNAPTGDVGAKTFDTFVLQLYHLLLPALEKVTHEIQETPGWVAPVAAPVLRLGRLKEDGKDSKYKKDRDRRLVIIDRREIEGVQAIKRQIETHLRLVEKKENERPLSIAVFGPPGSGKSSSVRSIVEMLAGDEVKTEILQFNLAQFTTSEELSAAFRKVVGSIAAQKIPITFFDEFDSDFNSKPLGWLRFFLAPMEDGKYDQQEVKNAVFVFAGGTSSTFAEFSLADRSKTDNLWVEFSKAKGPDFVSRLRGHLNVVGINPVGDDAVHVIRRAILIRAFLAEMQKLGDHDAARIDDEMLRAFLHVPEYRHGARSVRMLLEMCMTNDSSKWISKCEVPPLDQLNMQVDGKSFVDLVAGLMRE